MRLGLLARLKFEGHFERAEVLEIRLVEAMKRWVS